MKAQPTNQVLTLEPAVIEELRAVIGKANVLTDPDELLVYEADALTIHKHIPSAVVIPGTAEEVAAVVKILASKRIPFAPRGAGTGLSGGALSVARCGNPGARTAKPNSENRL